MTNFASTTDGLGHKILISSQLPQLITGSLVELNEFVVLEEAAGFAKAIPLPYHFYCEPEILSKDEIAAESESEVITISKLVVKDLLPDAPPVKAGWAKAVALPYYLESSYFFPNEILVVCVREDNEEAIAAGYARAVILPKA